MTEVRKGEMVRMLNTEYRLEVEDGQFTDGGREKIQP